MSFEAERRHYRVVYPKQVRPRLLTPEGTFEVLDLSEGGLRFGGVSAEAGDGRPPPPAAGDVVVGRVTFARGAAVDVRGRVIRAGQGEVAVELAEGVPFREILEEQRYLLARNYGLDW